MHYSKGLCKFCYLANYYKSRTGEKPPNDNGAMDNSDDEMDFEADNFG